uniref:Uncharacterized protein n=1 Tax=Aplanochytrium stocchinoi TaxID=215587 RepID=A0A7S3LMD5_9STRA
MAKDGIDPSILFGNNDAACSFQISKAPPVKISANALKGAILKKVDKSNRKSPLQKPVPRRPGVITLADLQNITLKKSTRNLGERKRPRNDTSSPFAITLDTIRSVKLRKTTTKNRREPIERNSNTNGSVLSLAALQSIKLRKTPAKPISDKSKQSNQNTSLPLQSVKLRKTRIRVAESSSSNGNDQIENTPANSNAANTSSRKTGSRTFTLSARDLLTVTLRKTKSERSPGGTPSKVKNDQFLSPSQARTEGEYLELALKKKFANTIMSTASPMNSPTSPSCWSVEN